MRWILSSLYAIGWCAFGVSSIAIPNINALAEGINIEKRQLTSVPENSYPVKSAFVGTAGNWAKFFFSTDNGKLYMGTWTNTAPSLAYGYEELLPAGSVKANTPIASTMWDLNVSVGSGLGWTNADKRARVYYLDSNDIIQELIYGGGTAGWSAGTIGALNIATSGTNGMSAISFKLNSAESVSVYYAESSGAVKETTWTASGTPQWTTVTVASSASAAYALSPITFVNTNTWSAAAPSIRGFYGRANTIRDVAWDTTWSTGNVAQSFIDSTGSTNGGYSFSASAWKVDAGTPIVHLFWCGDGAAAGTLGTVYRAPYNITAKTLGALTAISFTQAPHSFIVTGAGTNVVTPPNGNHLFAWGNSTGTPAFWHYRLNGDSAQLALH
ncbi:hypothetical protein AOL_s00007g341 [Orbilia oligospora ATCC 24927]|uniref:Fucose-specific lectin n=1 Tax=Arthrobotrys oligospora (strain ATCC 24927 / CBS 115.81 / DSM 1491) TaxID=756982 RepID=G1X232_ARTOA|nr:hypothetical protein AOL_s00007g341 [Orbilia oligospora ATCC 24927]EGX53005.1 hypothetical protein AOL_s00007g341 [Orbilia oligospora ATCC 24927]